MKKYLMTGIAALAMCAGFTSCSKDLTPMTQEEINDLEATKIAKTYEAAFLNYVGGTISPNQDWGFGNTSGARALTRAVDYTLKPVTPKYSQPANPSFTSEATITAKQPTISIEGYLTTASAVTDKDSGIPAANTIDWNNWTNEATPTVYLSTGNTSIKDNAKLTIYVVDNITFGTNTDAGSVIVVTEGKTLTLTSLNQNTKVILAEGAILDMSKATTWDGSISFAGSQSGLYMSRNSQIKGTKVSFFNGCQVINNNGTISITERIQVDKNSTLWNDGTFEKVSTLHMENENAIVYNAAGRTIEATNITTANNYGLLYNDGTVKVTEKLDLHNTNAEFVNSGTLEAGSLEMAAGSKFLNDDECTATIHGGTTINNSSAEWLNKGAYNSGDFTLNNAGKVYNNCKLTIAADAEGTTGTFTMAGTTHNEFVIMANASVKTDYFVLTAEGDMWMKENSLLWVVNKLTSSSFNPETGFHGTGSTASIIKAGEIAYSSAFRWRMNYFGKIYVDADKHFPQAFDTQNNPADQPHYYFDTTVGFKHHNDPCPITSTIAAGDCYHGYTPPTIVTSDGDLRVMAEDLNATGGDDTDFDFNDIVFDVYFGSTPKVVIRAAGGTLPLRIAKVQAPADDNDAHWSEVHDLFQSANPGKSCSGMMINTNGTNSNKPGVKAKSLDGLTCPEFTLPWAITTNAGVKEIKIQVKKNNIWCTIDATTGGPAAKFAVPTTYTWRNERVSIKDEVTTFTQWVAGNSSLVWPK